MSQLNYYTAERISEHVTRITSLTGEFIYLVEGECKAALIDTCLGVGHLRNFVEKITDKPIIVILTHGHVDHAMGAPEFDEVYMNSADNKIFQEHKLMEARKGYIHMVLAGRMPEIDDYDFVQPSEPNFKELKDGMVYDLGGLNLELYETPGHTPGSMAILIREERTLLLGDACNTFTFLFDEYALSVEEYRDVLQRLDQLTKNKYDKVYLSHGLGDASKEMIASAIEVCNDIISGNADDIPFNFMEKQAVLAKTIGEDRNRTDGGLANIIYDKNKVFVKKTE